ncbi:hypothetical protein [Phocaeicola dorei]|uniref:hypothetical protein n=1 Tax=Phocaeicola dorei TaxID=357276 RepID=UPI00162803D7|nr:hypothetical protein [Phocaeicola dorei]
MRYPAAGTASYDGFSCQLLFVEGRICKKYTSSRRIKRGSLPLHLKNRTVTAGKERGIKGNRQRSCGNLQTGIVPFTDDVVIGTIPYHSLLCQNRYLKGRNAANRPSFVLAKYKTL